MKRIRLENTVFEGLNNTYLLDGDGPTTLVDTGVATPDTRGQLRDSLAEAGLDFADIDQVLLTHFHADHAGLAGEIQAAGDATVRVHAADAEMVEQDADATEAMEAERDRLFDAWGMPTDAREELLGFIEAGKAGGGDPASVEPIADGDEVRAGDRTLEVVHLPGHTAGLCGFVDGDALFSGDALLPHYTPNVGGADTRVDSPLAKYLDTLTTIESRNFDVARPGHREYIEDPAGRARTIIDHHRERTERVVGVLDEHGPADPWTVSAHLFGDLENIHILHGPGEAYAHLEHLQADGIVENTADGYTLVDGSADLDALFPAPPA